MEQPTLHEPGLNPRENFLSDTPTGRMQHFGYSKLLQEINEALVHCWLKSEISSKGICIALSDSSNPQPLSLPIRECP